MHFDKMGTLDLIINFFYLVSARSLARLHGTEDTRRSAEADFSTERVPRAATVVRSVASK